MQAVLLKNFLKGTNVEWWPSPPESLDLNPIENVWGSMKQYLRTAYKPKNLRGHREVLDYTDTGCMQTVHWSLTKGDAQNSGVAGRAKWILTMHTYMHNLSYIHSNFLLFNYFAQLFAAFLLFSLPEFFNFWFLVSIALIQASHAFSSLSSPSLPIGKY